jgi:hypothetical protein
MLVQLALRARALAWVHGACLAFCFVSPARADDDEKGQCIAASEQGQVLRNANSYSSARHAFERCAQESCPDILRQRCVTWLNELNERFPSVIVAARDERGNDIVPVRVLVDGTVLTESADAAALSVEPGQHVFRYEHPGTEPFEEHVVILPGEKGRRLIATLRPLPKVVTVQPLVEPAPASRSWQALGWGFAGLGALAFASEAYFGISGSVERSNDLSTTGCAPRCSSGQTQSVQTKFIIADTSLAIGVVSAGAALYFLLKHPERPPASAVVTVDVVPQAGGVVATMGGRWP